MKKILEFLKEKANLIVSLVTLAAALANTIIKYFAPGKLSGTMDSVVLTLIAFQLLGLLVWRLDAIQGTLKRLEDGETKGVQLKKRDEGLVGQMIVTTKEEMFFCGCDLMRLIPQRANLLALPEKTHVRMLVMNIDDEAVTNGYKVAFGRSPDMVTLAHIDWVLSRQNFEVRIVDFPLTVFISAKDMQTATGSIQVSFRYFGEFGQSSPCIDLSPSDTEWYDFYKNQIEELWKQGTPWEP